MAEQGEAASVADHNQTGRRLRELLRPVQGPTRWALREQGRAERVRYLETNARRWLDRAGALPLASEQAQLLDEAAACLEGFDALDAGEREQRLRRLSGALKGLTRRPPRTKKKDRGRSGRDKRTKAKNQAAPPAQRRSATPRLRPVRPLEHPEGGGALLEELGVAGDIAAALSVVNVETGQDLLWRAPADVEVLKPLHGAGRPLPDGRIAVGGRLRWRATRCSPDGGRAGLLGLQGAGPLTVSCHPRIDPSRLVFEEKVALVGEANDGAFVAEEVASGDGRSGVRLARYGLGPVADVDVRHAVRTVLRSLGPIAESLPPDIVARHHLPSLHAALNDVHLAPQPGGAAQQRLLFEEGLMVSIGSAGGPKTDKRGIPHTLGHGHLALASQLRGWELSDPAQAALEAIKRDLRSSRPGRRLLTGEAATGKGLVATMAAIIAAEGRTQVVWLAPTEALARQRATFLEKILKDLGLVVRTLSSRPDAAQQDALRRGEVHILVAARTAPIANLEFRRLGLLIAEERRTYGWAAELHAHLSSPQPDLLVLNPAPVAIDLLFTVYGDFDVSVLWGRPVDVPCALVDAREREAAYSRVHQCVAEGRQAVVFFPMLRGKDVLGQADALRLKSALQTEFLTGLRVGLLHGAMSGSERLRVIEEVRRHQLDVLISTTAFEDGPPMDRVTVGVIEEADRVDAVRLLRIRRHLAGRDGTGRCFLVFGSEADADDRARVSRVVQQEDGFRIAEAEVERLGIGPFIEAGPIITPPTLHWRGTDRDVAVLVASRACARRLLAEDPGLRRRSAASLADAIRARWGLWSEGECPLLTGRRTGGSRRRRRRRK